MREQECKNRNWLRENPGELPQVELRKKTALRASLYGGVNTPRVHHERKRAGFEPAYAELRGKTGAS